MHVIHSMKQGEAESMDNFYVRVKDEVDKMKLTDLNVNQLVELVILSQLVNCTNNTALTRKAIKDNQNLTQFREFARTSELTEQQVSGMTIQETHYVHKKSQKDGRRFKKKTKPGSKSKSEEAKERKPQNCEYCGDSCVKGKCPAFGKICKKCGKRNHAAKVCKTVGQGTQRQKSNRIHLVAEEEEFDDLDSDDSIYQLQDGSKKQYFAKLTLETENGPAQLKLQLDTGASCSTMTIADYRKITKLPLKTSMTRLTLYDGTVIKPLGCATFRCQANDIVKKIHFEVIKEAPTSLLSANACAALKLVSFNKELVCQVTCQTKEMSKEDIFEEFSDVFKGLGKLPGAYAIEMDKEVKPVQNNPRRVPVCVRDQLKLKLTELEEQGVILKVTVPTPWISNMVVVQKPNKLRVCLDPNRLNTAIQRNHYPTPTLEDIAPKLANAKVFSVMDAKDGFLQVALDEASSYLTTFWTPFGRYRWLRMPFGLKSAPEEFQRRLDACLEGLENVAVIADDILVFGTGKTTEEATLSHDKAIRALLDRCREQNLKLNKKKIRYKMDEISYMGHKLTQNGLSPCPDKVRAIAEMERPKDTAGVQRLIGVVTYLAKFLPRLSTVCEPLRRLTDKNAVFDWLPQHEKAFEKVKELITNAPVLKYYDATCDVTIECDSSDVGLGAVLLQNGQPVAFASRALTKTERNYAQIEKECLSIVFATTRFEHYILGKERIKIENDHKPLATIFKKSILTSPKRLQRMLLKLLKYNLEVTYKPGPQMHISDTLSRASLPIPKMEATMPDYLIYQIKEDRASIQEFEQVEPDLHVTDHRLQQIKECTTRDQVLQTLVKVTSEGWPNSKQEVPLCIREYWPYRDELSVHDGLAYRGTRIVIPATLQKEMVERAHKSHLGEQYTINTAREIMYWPQMHQHLVEAVKSCTACLENQPAQSQEPLMTYPLPQHPWQVVASDMFVLQNKTFAVLVDTYSDFIEVCPLKDQTSTTLITGMKQSFATHGVPALLISDNGPNYASQEFKQFAHDWCFNHVTSSPHHHKSNGKAESAVKIVKKIIKRAWRNNEDHWAALLEWRNSITPNMKSSPAQRLMSRRTRSLLPCAPSKLHPEVQADVSSEVKKKRQVSKKYHDAAMKNRELPKLVIGQPVRVKTQPQKPLSKWTSGQVVSVAAPRSYIVEVDGQRYRRNRIHLRDTIASKPVQNNIAPPNQAQPGTPVRVPDMTTSTPVSTPRRDSPVTPSTPNTPVPISTPRRSPNGVKTTRSGRTVRTPDRFKE